MSAYIVEDKTINRVVSWLVLEVRNHGSAYILQQELSAMGYDTSDHAFAEKLAKDMFELNVDAVRQRYDSKEEAPTFTYTPLGPEPLIQILKSLKCWVYQCSEGDVPERKLYRFFAESVERYILRKIVFNMPEYDEAEWA